MTNGVCNLQDHPDRQEMQEYKLGPEWTVYYIPTHSYIAAWWDTEADHGWRARVKPMDSASVAEGYAKDMAKRHGNPSADTP